MKIQTQRADLALLDMANVVAVTGLGTDNSLMPDEEARLPDVSIGIGSPDYAAKFGSE